MSKMRASLVAQLVKNLPAMQATWVWSLGWEDPLEKGTTPTPVFWRGNSHGFRRTDVEAETPILWPPDVKNWLIRKDPDGGKDWRREEKGMTEDEMAGWHHRLNGHEFEQAPGAGDGQGGLVCFSPWGHKELDMIEWLNWIELNYYPQCKKRNAN